MIVEAYSAGDKEVLRPLLADDVFNGFAGAIDQRQAAGQTLDTQLIAIASAERGRGRAAGLDTRASRSASPASRSTSCATRDGNVIDGDPATAEEVVDIWTFERDTRSADPNWTLVETRTPS